MRKLYLTVCILIAITLVFAGCKGNLTDESQTEPDSSSLEISSSDDGAKDSWLNSDELTSDSSSDFESSSDISSSDENSSQETSILPGSLNIGLYSGRGSWDINVEAFRRFFETNGYNWDEFDQNDLVEDEFLTQFDLIWFPGGFSSEYRAYISADGHENIKKYVNNGGNIAGSCAGAYFASDIMVWYGEESGYPIKIFNGKAIGPLSGLVAWGEIAQVQVNENIFAQEFTDTLPVYYYDGPYFVTDESEDIAILARYEINNEAAVISGNYGNGGYILFGPHPELGGDYSSSSGINVDGEEGAQWEWMNKSLRWFFTEKISK